VSDGWELENPELVGLAMQQLSRLAFHVIWVNPRKAARGYRPLVGGMAAAMPYVDTFVSGHSLRALEEVMAAIRDAADDGRHHEHVRPVHLPTAAQEAVAVEPAPEPTPPRDKFPTGTIVTGRMSG
jgi:hypothetical protein